MDTQAGHNARLTKGSKEMNTTNTNTTIRNQAADQWAKVDACYAEETNWLDLEAVDTIESFVTDTGKAGAEVEVKVTAIMKEAAEAMKAAKHTPKGKVNGNAANPIKRKAMAQWVELKGTHQGFWDAFSEAMKEQGILW